MSPEVVEVTFKRNRKCYFFNSKDIDLRINDSVIVEVDKGEDMGQITQTGRLVMLKDIKNEPGNIIRKAESGDTEKLVENRRKEASAFYIGKEFSTMPYFPKASVQLGPSHHQCSISCQE